MFWTVERGETHRWGLSKARDVLYNKHTHALSLKHTLCHVRRSVQKACVLTSRASKCPNTSTRAALWVHDESAAWSSQCIQTEGQAEKDRWWCTSDFNSQGTPRFSPGCCTLSHKAKWPKTTEGGLKWKFGKLAGIKKRAQEINFKEK